MGTHILQYDNQSNIRHNSLHEDFFPDPDSPQQMLENPSLPSLRQQMLTASFQGTDIRKAESLPPQVMLTASFQGTDSVVRKALDKAKECGMVVSGDQVVALHGQKEECAGATNLLKVVTVP